MQTIKTNPVLEELKTSLFGQIQALSEKNGTGTFAQSVLEKAGHLTFPGTKNEEWKYSPFSPKKDSQFVLSKGQSKEAAKKTTLENCYILHFSDGWFSESESILPTAKGIQIGPLENPLNELPGYENNLFGQLNLATASVVGLSVHIAPLVVVDKPIVFSFSYSSTNPDSWVQPRIQAVVGERAEVSFAEIGHFPDQTNLVVNSVVEIQVGASAQVWWTNIENGSAGLSLIHQTRVTIEEKSVFQHIVLSMGEGFIRNNLEIAVRGTLADAHMYGLTLGNHGFHVDHHTFVNHKAENTTSNQLYKTILGGKSTGIFNGKILVDQVAQKTNAYQSSKNILISNDAKVFAKPQLEIFADDVKCSHGATIGQLDEEPIFYLRSRGLDEITARKLLIQAFASEVLGKIPDEKFRNKISKLVESGMEQLVFKA